jgi:hypothetical protein
MKIIPAKTEFNWLWKLAIFFYCQFLICQLLINDSGIYTVKYDMNNTMSSYFFVILFMLVPPIIEEFIYRGIFTKNKISIFFSLVFYLGTSIMLFLSGIKVWWIFLFITFLVLFFVLNKQSKIKKGILIIYSASLFTLAHLSVDSTFQEFFLRSGNYLGGGLFLSWIVINYSIFKSILVHLTYNIIVFSFFIVFAAKISVSSNYKNTITYSIEEVSFLKNSKNVSRTENGFYASQANLSFVLPFVDIPKDKNVYIKNPISKFNITINSKEAILKDDDILQVLLEAEVIQLR